jgi:hypothetical protein
VPQSCAQEGAACDDGMPCCSGACNAGTCEPLCAGYDEACNDEMPCCSGTCLQPWDPEAGQLECVGLMSGCTCGE